MTFKPKFANYEFTKISVDNFIEKYKMNPKEDLSKLRKKLLYFRQLKKEGVKCDCGNFIMGQLDLLFLEKAVLPV